MASRGWKITWWLLSAIFVLTAALNLLHVRGGFLTSHAADLCVPAWLYIHLRGLNGTPPRMSGMRRLGRTPERAATFLFLASAATEVSQRFWPHGLFSGTFDPLDLLAYGVGLLVCYVPDRFVTGSSPSDPRMRDLQSHDRRRRPGSDRRLHVPGPEQDRGPPSAVTSERLGCGATTHLAAVPVSATRLARRRLPCLK